MSVCAGDQSEGLAEEPVPCPWEQRDRVVGAAGRGHSLFAEPGRDRAGMHNNGQALTLPLELT